MLLILRALTALFCVAQDIAAVPALQQRALPYDPNTLPPFVYPVPPLVEPALQRAQISAALAPQGKPGVAPVRRERVAALRFLFFALLILSGSRPNWRMRHRRRSRP